MTGGTGGSLPHHSTAALADGRWRPSHAYIPGQNVRHEEGLFDVLTSMVQGCAVDDLPLTLTWRYASAFFDDGFYWEAHELLEAIWMVCPPNSAEKLYVQARIQRANAALKSRMGLARAVARLNTAARELEAEAARRSPDTLFGGMVSH